MWLKIQNAIYSVLTTVDNLSSVYLYSKNYITVLFVKGAYTSPFIWIGWNNYLFHYINF